MKAMSVAGHARLESVSIETVADYVRGVIEEVSAIAGCTGERCRVHLPDLEIEMVSHDPQMSHAMKWHLASGAPEDGTLRRLTGYIVHPGVERVSAPLPWDANRPAHPQRIAEALSNSGLQASYFSDLDHWHMYDHSSGIAVQLMRAPGEYPAWETGAPLRPFLHWHYAREGRRLAHCGTLGIDGQGIILAGAGGSGKSGTVMAGLLHGLQSVGDDYVLLETGHAVIARPLFTTLKQDPAGVVRLGLNKRPVANSPLNWQGKHQLRISDISKQPIPDRLSIMALMLPRIKGSGMTEIRPVGRADAMIALAASSIYQMPGERESGFRHFGEITRQLPCFSLLLGPDPAEVAQTITEFIGGRAS